MDVVLWHLVVEQLEACIGQALEEYIIAVVLPEGAVCTQFQAQRGVKTLLLILHMFRFFI